MVVATIKKQSAFQLESSADVYIHNVSWAKVTSYMFQEFAACVMTVPFATVKKIIFPGMTFLSKLLDFTF